MARSHRQVYGTTIAPPPGGGLAPAAFESAPLTPLPPPTAPPPAAAPIAVGFDATDADEMAILYVMRLLNQASQPRPLTPVENAFVTGARAMFAQLTKVCDDLMQKVSPVLSGPLAAATEVPTAEAAGATTGEEPRRSPRTRRRAEDAVS
jgi:hypothetical protein